MNAKPTTPHDYDIDMQLVDISPEHGGSSLRLSISNDKYIAAPNQAAASRLDTINLAATPPTMHKSPRKVTTLDNHSAKRRRSEEGRPTTHSDSNKSHNMGPKEAIPSIEMVSQMWLGFPIHEAAATQRGKEVLRENRTNEDFAELGTPSREVIDFMTLRRAFPRVPRLLYPNDQPDAVPGNHLHFTQLPKLEKVAPTTGLSEGFQVTIRFDYGYNNITRQDARGACIERLRQMGIPLGTAYSNPIDIGINAITKKLGGVHQTTSPTPATRRHRPPLR